MCIPKRWVKRRVETFGETMGEASWFPFEGSNDFPVSHSPFSTQLIFLLSLSHQQELLFPFPPGCSEKEDASHPWSPSQKATNPQRGHLVLGQWPWWGNAAAPGAVKAPPGKAQGCSQVGLKWHRLDGMCCHCKWGDLGWCPTRERNTEATQAPEVFVGVSVGLSSVTAWGQPVVPPSHQPRTPILVSVMRNLTPKHSCMQRWCTELGNKPQLWTSAIKTNQWNFLQTFSAFQQKHKTQLKSDKIFWYENTDTNLRISRNIYGVIFQTFFNSSSSFSKSILCFQLFAFTLSYRAENVLKMLFLYQHFHLGTKATITLIQQQWCM